MINPLNKTEYSFRYAYGKIKDVVTGSIDGSVVIADRFTTFGHIPFYNLCKKNNKKPILGVELAFVDDALLKVRQNASHVTLLAINKEGLSTIYNLVSKSSEQKYYYNRLSKKDLRKINQDNVIIVYKEKLVEEYLINRKNTFLAVTPLTNYSEIMNSKHPLIAASDNLYNLPTEEESYQFIMGNGQWESRTTPAHVMSDLEWTYELDHLHDELKKEAIKNTHLLARSIEGFDLPTADLPRTTEKRTLKELCIEGAIKRKCDLENKVYKDRLERELKLIYEKKYEEYFYLVWDLVIWAKQKMLVGPARGSSAGSLVCYLLFITDVDPIPFDLIFERFIDINRLDIPDIDIDFQDTKRDKLLGYLKEKYGEDCVAQLGTVSKYKPKSILTEIAKCLRIPSWEMNDLKNAIPERSSGDARASNCIEDTFTTIEVGKAFLEKYPPIIYSQYIEGHNRHFGKHAAGIVVADTPINNYCAVDFTTGSAMLDKKDAESVNLLKMDCLGLRTLSVIQDCLDLIKKDRDWLTNYPLDDKKAFAVINQKKFSGIFQFEGYALINIAKQILIQDFETVAAITALARPGPLVSGGTNKYITFKNDPDNVKHMPKCEAYTKDTYGVVVYQEQVMNIVRNVGALSWEDTSELRKAMSKSYGDEFFDKYKNKFIKGAKNKHNLPEEEALTIWNSVNTMGSWAFNKCLSGDTKIRMGATGGSINQWMTIKELYDKYIDNPTSWTKYRKPILQSLYPDNRVRPNQCLDIYKSGIKNCYKFIFEDETEITCTKEHKFIINDEWNRIGTAKIGDYFSYSDYEKAEKKGHNSKRCRGKKYSKPQEGFLAGKDNPSYINGKTEALNEFRELMNGMPCEDTGEFHARMEVHHNDFNSGHTDPFDLSWLTPSAHKKRHYENNRTKRWGKGHKVYKKKLIGIERIGDIETYDISMKDHHNFIIDGGIITHNSHAISYGLISYWCMVLKSYHPLEFALATLKNAKDEEQVINILKELSKEDYKYQTFNKDTSLVDWSIQDGKLVGGFINIKGIGIKKAQTLIKKRREGTELTVAEKRTLFNAETPYDKIFEFKENFQGFYDNWELFFKDKPVLIEDIEEGEEVRYLCKTISHSIRDMNEEILIKKRDGKIITDGCCSFLDLKMADDTDTVQGRIGRDLFEKFGRQIAEKDKVGSYYVVKGFCCKDFKYIIVQNIKKVTQEEIELKIRSKE